MVRPHARPSLTHHHLPFRLHHRRQQDRMKQSRRLHAQIVRRMHPARHVPKLDQSLKYVTVDYVKSAVNHIASSNEKLGRSYSILSPDQSKSVTVRVEQIFVKQRPDGLLASLLPMFRERVLGRLARWEGSQ